MEIEHFINSGYGWLCKHCQLQNEARADQANGRARFFSEGEAEDKDMKLSATAMARWRDVSRETLICPRCGVEEYVNKA